MNRNGEGSHRRSSILRAINDRSMSLVSSSMSMDERDYNERSFYSFRDSFNVTGYSCNDDNNNDDKSIDGNGIKSVGSLREDKPVILVKVEERNIEVPARMIAELKNIEANKTFDDITDLTGVERSSIFELESEEAMVKTPDRRKSVTGLSTEAVVEMCNRVSSVLTDIRCDSTLPRYLRDTDFATIAEDTDCRSSNVIEHSPIETTERSADFYLKNKKMSISPKSSKRRSVNKFTAEALEDMCHRVSSVLTDIRCDSTDPRDCRDTDYATIGEEANCRSSNLTEHPLEESTGRDADSSSKKSVGSWDEDRFLEIALGDDRFEENLTDGVHTGNGTCSDLAAIEPISERSPIPITVLEPPNIPKTKSPSCRNSNTLNRSMSIYRTLSHRIKKKFRPIFRPDRKEEAPKASVPIPSRIDDSDRIGRLLREVKIQQTIINQSTKALDLCTSLKQFTDSTERAESERSLLLASLRGKAALEEIKFITSDEQKKDIFSEKGEVTISEMSLDLRSCIGSEDDETEWFVVVVSQGLRVWATRPVSCRTEDNRVNFTGSVSMADLTPGFKVLVRVYTLKLGRDVYSDEDKYRKRKISRKHFRLSSSSIFGKTDVSSPIRNRVLGTANTSFVLSGFTELVLHDLSVCSPWPLIMVPANSRLRGSIDLDIACRLHFSMRHEGFLNHGDEAGGLASWNRRWCVLRGHTLKFWNYPREEETKEPLKVIELMDCVSDVVATVDRKICAKPRTLLIETKRSRQPGDRNSIIIECKSACTIVRNLLSYDSAPELDEWCRKINEVIAALEDWNVIGRRSQSSGI